MTKKLVLGVLASGRGSNFQAIIDSIEAGAINAVVGLLVVDRSDAYAIERARKHGIEYRYIDPKEFRTKDDLFIKIAEELTERGVELVVLAGFMRVVRKPLIDAFPNRIMNIHPALLPSFPGLHGQKQAADYGVRISGSTVHFVDEGMDTGPVIIQAAVPVSPDDTEETLSERILKLEHRIFPSAADDGPGHGQFGGHAADDAQDPHGSEPAERQALHHHRQPAERPGDYSEVTFPQDVRNCTQCHKDAAQVNNWMLNPTGVTCGSCHDTVNFATGENHAGGAQRDDSKCSLCHWPQSDTEYDSSVAGAHTVPYKSNQLRNPVWHLLSITDTAPGQKPTVKFQITDKTGAYMKPSDFVSPNRLRLDIAGPNTDYRWYMQETASMAPYDEATHTATYTFTGAIPADASGSYTVAMEGRLWTTLNPGTTKAVDFSF